MERPCSTAGLGCLAVNGSAPPTRAGASRRGTASRTAKTAESPIEALTQALIKKMRERFGELSKDVKSQEMIAKEVTQFMATAGSVREGDLAHLEDRIRSRLSGDTPQRSTLAAQKRAQQAGDEWAKMYAFSIVEGKEIDASKRAQAAARSAAVKVVLDSQIKHKMSLEEQEAAAADDYFHKEQAALKEWEAQEEAKRKLQQDIMEKLKADRQAQLEERARRKQMAEEKRAREEAELAARLAYEARMEFEKEEAARIEAKRALKEFLLNNEIYKQIKVDAKVREWEHDQKCIAENTAMWDKQERARQEQIDKLKVWQAKQEAEAKARPEAKQWIDPAIIDRYTQEREAALIADEARRKAAVVASNKRLVQSLEEQLKIQQARKEAEKAEEQTRAQQLQVEVQKEIASKAAEKQKEANKKLAFRVQLEAQMKDNARRKIIAPMSDTEKLINSGMLHKVEQMTLGRPQQAASGKIGAAY